MMRAKMKIESVKLIEDAEVLNFEAVTANAYPSDGSDENNTFARWTPSANLSMVVTNPDLHGKFKPGQEFYVDFCPVPVSE